MTIELVTVKFCNSNLYLNSTRSILFQSGWKPFGVYIRCTGVIVRPALHTCLHMWSNKTNCSVINSSIICFVLSRDAKLISVTIRAKEKAKGVGHSKKMGSARGYHIKKYFERIAQVSWILKRYFRSWSLRLLDSGHWLNVWNMFPPETWT